MAYTPNYLSGKNGFVLLGVGGGFAGGNISGGVPVPTSYTTTWAFGKWRCGLRAATPKVTNFTGVRSFTTPTNLTGVASNVTQAFQQLVTGVLNGTINLEGPYDAGNMPLIAGSQYAFILGLVGNVAGNGTVPGYNQIGTAQPGIFLGIQAYAIVSDIEPFVDVEGAEMIRVTAESNDYFTPYVA